MGLCAQPLPVLCSSPETAKLITLVQRSRDNTSGTPQPRRTAVWSRVGAGSSPHGEQMATTLHGAAWGPDGPQGSRTVPSSSSSSPPPFPLPFYPTSSNSSYKYLTASASAPLLNRQPEGRQLPPLQPTLHRTGGVTGLRPPRHVGTAKGTSPPCSIAK